MSALLLIGIGIVTGLTTVLFGFGGGFVTVPVIVWADAGLGPSSAHVAAATSSLVMVVSASVATAATNREILRLLRGSTALLGLLALGGAAGTIEAQHAPQLVTQWGFVAYLILTIADLALRPGFFQPRTQDGRRESRRTEASPDQAGGRDGAPVPVALGLPSGAVAAFLGVGGSVMTVPLLRRSGKDMGTATSLANPLTLAIAVPALAVFLTQRTGPGPAAGVFLELSRAARPRRGGDDRRRPTRLTGPPPLPKDRAVGSEKIPGLFRSPGPGRWPTAPREGYCGM